MAIVANNKSINSILYATFHCNRLTTGLNVRLIEAE